MTRDEPVTSRSEPGDVPDLPGPHADDPDPRAETLVRAAVEVLTAALPGAVASRAAHDELVAAVPADLEGLGDGARRRVTAAMILVKTRANAVYEAVALADAERALLPAARKADLGDAALSACWAAASEAYAALGLPRRGSACARNAAEYARAAGDDAHLFRALELLTVNRALNGELGLTRESANAAHELERKHGWENTSTAYLLLVGEVLHAYDTLDVDTLVTCAERFRRGQPGDPAWVAMACYAEAIELLIRGRHSEALAAITRVTNSSDQLRIPLIVQGFATGFVATVLTARGEPQRVLQLLDGRESSPGHALCYDVHRASAYLLLGNDRQALVTTDGCMRLGTDHCLRTLPPVLLQRAIANHRLGHHAAADAALADAFSLYRSTGATGVPLSIVPRGDLEELLARLRARQPHLASDIDELSANALASFITVPTDLPVPPSLTKRETLVAHQLRGQGTMAEIAGTLLVSVNTIKTQIRSLYHKLGVSSREDAVAHLERSGFYDRSS
ncbi:helix-turn-helix transcriptional regulator [Propionicicella superfundia]|uniref:helix-turn-helix transcriptional regulator n=1 Tax=Propionicicella superfundia TaxID=348582 RepID=UPI0003FA548D|nr:helix-turn-helix transcriptional regulator [Propionicicella superfundia]